MLEAFRTHSNPLIYSDTDWTDMLIRKTAVQTQHNFNISGGSKRVRYFASLGVFTQDGLFKTFDTHGHKTGFKYIRYNYRVNMDVDVTKNPDHTECIRCGMCIRACPTDAIRFRYGFGEGKDTEKTEKAVPAPQNNTQ